MSQCINKTTLHQILVDLNLSEDEPARVPFWHVKLEVKRSVNFHFHIFLRIEDHFFLLSGVIIRVGFAITIPVFLRTKIDVRPSHDVFYMVSFITFAFKLEVLFQVLFPVL